MSGTNTTVVVATRNRCGELLRTLGHLERLRPQPPIVVVDNASSDDTARAVCDRHPRVRLIRMPRNTGAVARNLGVLSARTPYIAFSDDDSWWADGALPEAERIFDSHPRVGLIAARTLVGARNRADPLTADLQDSPLRRSENTPGPRILGFSACSAIVRRDAFLGVGGFSPVLVFVAEEKLLAYDLTAAGWELIHLGSVVAHHHPSPRRQPPTQRRVLELRNNVLIDWMRHPWRHAVTTTLHLARRIPQDDAALPALLGVVGKLPAAIRHRHRLPECVEQDIRLLQQHS